MKKLQYIILFCFLVKLCFAQDSSQINSTVSGDTTQPAYVLASHDSIIHIPDSAGVQSLHGYAYLLLYVDDNSTIYEVSIVKIALSDGNKPVIKYISGKKYVSGNLEHYSRFFDEYCRKILKVEKTGTPKKQNALTVRFIVQ
jgi:hypothetical protein